VLEEACSRLADWRARGLLSSTVSVSVNVSGRQVDDVALPQTIAAALERSGLPASALRLELTETTILREPERVREVLGELVRIGVRAQIDDFGTGYSSLSFLHGFPGDALKIARGFVASVNESEASQAIVAGIVALAHNLGLSLVAEGVENEAQARKLRLLGCEYAQGFLFGRPLPPEELEEVLAGWDAAGVAAIGTGPTLARQPSAS
jgi:EAL domain-containing protein (putative c-di-GMP-specific phosphodiesterase class I)